MRLVKRSAKNEAERKRSLVAVVDAALPATSPMEQMCAEQYQRMYERLCAVAARILGEDAARDVVHDVLLRFWKRWDELTPEERSDSVVMTSVKNQVIDVMRRDRRSVELTSAMVAALEHTGEIPVINPIESADSDLAETAKQIVAQLPPRSRESYLLVNVYGFTYKEAAAAQDITAEGVKDNLKRANILIREALTDGGYRVGPGAQTKALPRSTEASNE
jgi:RNA polymerase sigma-70 factor (ECF subfamily)